jgi:broad specificity phosphatase PhoE
VTNHLAAATALANRYHAMRHGQSQANAAGLIVSSIARDRAGDYGLTAVGREQALAAAAACGLPAGTLVVTSDFARARQTAEIARDRLGAAPATVSPALRERFFGELDGGPVSGYPLVWAADAAGDETGAYGAEPAAAVLDRTTALVAALERRHAGADILLVSHGDPLQILQAGFARVPPSRHRDLPHLETAEIRPLRLAAG